MSRKEYKVNIIGSRNPALVAYEVLKSMKVDINEQTFREVAEICGDKEGSFIVSTYEDLLALIELGGFSIVVEDGIYKARMEE